MSREDLQRRLSPKDDLKIVLVTSDKEEIVCNYEILKRSALIRNMYTDLGVREGEEVAPLKIEHISGPIMKKVIEWCDHHKNDPIICNQSEKLAAIEQISEKGISSWDREFFEVDALTMKDILNAANFMDIEKLLQYAAYVVSFWASYKSPDELLAFFQSIRPPRQTNPFIQANEIVPIPMESESSSTTESDEGVQAKKMKIEEGESSD